MMKKLGAVALCAAVILMVFVQPASAAGGLTITQVKESAPEYWETGIVKNGEQVSAPVYVPDVEQMPVLRVRKGLFDDERLAAVFGQMIINCPVSLRQREGLHASANASCSHTFGVVHAIEKK